MHVPGAVLVGDSAGFVDMMALKGVHNAILSGTLAAEAIYEALKAGKATTPAGLWGYTTRVRESAIWKELWKVRDIRPAFQKGFVYGGMVHGMQTAFGKARASGCASSRTPPSRSSGLAQRRYPKPDGEYVFDKLGSVFASGNQTRDDQPSHIRVRTQVPVELATAWEWMCPAKVYEIADEPQNGTVTVHLSPSNCVQCGAITAKGGA